MKDLRVQGTPDNVVTRNLHESNGERKEDKKKFSFRDFRLSDEMKNFIVIGFFQLLRLCNNSYVFDDTCI